MIWNTQLSDLIASLADVEKQKADKTMFLGDYYSGTTVGNEEVETIRKLNSTIVIRGYLINV